MRRIDERIGVRNSRIAFDIVLLFYEHATAIPSLSLSVDQVADVTGYSGPTVRLIIKRLMDAGTLCFGRRVGKTQLYDLTPEGKAGFGAYLTAILEFRIS